MGKKSSLLVYFMIVHYTYGWTQRFVTSFFKHLPNETLIVFNNNPQPKQKIRKTRGNRGMSQTWNALCEEEIKFLQQPQIQLCEIPRDFNDTYELPTHGNVLDYVFPWLQQNGCQYAWHLEPDCKIHGNQWHSKAWEIRNDNTVVGLGQMHIDDHFVMSICPTLWDVNKVVNLGISFEKVKPNINTGQKLLRTCEQMGQAKTVQASDFIHYSGGTKKSPFLML